MIVCIDDNKKVLWLHDDDEVKQLPQYINDENVFIVDKHVAFKKVPQDRGIYYHIWNSETQDIDLIKVGETPLTLDEVSRETHSTVESSSFDNLINMDMLLALDEKLNVIMEHLGIEY